MKALVALAVTGILILILAWDRAYPSFPSSYLYITLAILLIAEESIRAAIRRRRG